MLGGRAAEEIVYGTQHDRRRERHRAGDRARAQHGHALGHERRARAWCSSRRAQNPYLGGARRSAASSPFSEETARVDRRRGAADHRREPRRGASGCCASTARQLDALVEALLERETLDEHEILEVTGPAARAAARDPSAGVAPRDRARDRAAPPRPRRLRGRARAAVRQAAHGRARSSSSTTWARSTSRPASRARVDVRPHPHIGLSTRHLPVRGRDHAPRQRRLGAGDPPRRGQLDDRRARHHPLRALRARAPRGRPHARHPGLGGAAATRTRRSSPASRTTAPSDLPRQESAGCSGALVAGEAFGARVAGEDPLAAVLRRTGSSQPARAPSCPTSTPSARVYVAPGAVEVARPALRRRARWSSSRRARRSRSRRSSRRS